MQFEIEGVSNLGAKYGIFYQERQKKWFFPVYLKKKQLENGSLKNAHASFVRHV